MLRGDHFKTASSWHRHTPRSCKLLMPEVKKLRNSLEKITVKSSQIPVPGGHWGSGWCLMCWLGCLLLHSKRMQQLKVYWYLPKPDANHQLPPMDHANPPGLAAERQEQRTAEQSAGPLLYRPLLFTPGCCRAGSAPA